LLQRTEPSLRAELNFPAAPDETRAQPGAASKHGGYVPARAAQPETVTRLCVQPIAAPEVSLKRLRASPAAATAPPAKRRRSSAIACPRLSLSLLQAADLLAAAEAAAEEVVILLRARQAVSAGMALPPPWLRRALGPILHLPAQPKSVLVRPLAQQGGVSPPLPQEGLLMARCKENGEANGRAVKVSSAFAAWPVAKHAPLPRCDSLALTL